MTRLQLGSSTRCSAHSTLRRVVVPLILTIRQVYTLSRRFGVACAVRVFSDQTFFRVSVLRLGTCLRIAVRGQVRIARLLQCRAATTSQAPVVAGAAKPMVQATGRR